ncbi:MAG: hypothetical protein K0B00_13460 [Rhodobacteraceae bacterium]|nr:hypothetical protein [Paracoccaceae bacterium]
MRPIGQTVLAALFAATLIGSFFLPVISLPLLAKITPVGMLQDLGFDGLREMAFVVQLFFASFPLAALVLVLALLRLCPGLLALASGAVPIGVVIYAAFNLNDELRALGLPLTVSDFSDFLGAGAYLYIGGAVGLVVLAVTDRGQA